MCDNVGAAVTPAPEAKYRIEFSFFYFFFLDRIMNINSSDNTRAAAHYYFIDEILMMS